MWTFNATYVEWVECDHVNKTGLILQLETQIYDVTCQLDLATIEGQPHTLQKRPDGSMSNCSHYKMAVAYGLG